MPYCETFQSNNVSIEKTDPPPQNLHNAPLKLHYVTFLVRGPLPPCLHGDVFAMICIYLAFFFNRGFIPYKTPCNFLTNGGNRKLKPYSGIFSMETDTFCAIL
ncbi:hypothetical protein NL108_008963 [Boleophthalmus pectinirostris]|nr:hypothetical protein NL108_008963 [Boleophthalmus pectinirostris]